MNTVELASRILTQLGFSQEPSKELGADDRRDRIIYLIEEYTHPVKELTDEEIVELGENTLPNEAIGFVPMWQWIDFARAILRKASEK